MPDAQKIIKTAVITIIKIVIILSNKNFLTYKHSP